MRSIFIVGLFAMNLAVAGEPDYSEVRELSADAVGASLLSIDTGSGSLQVEGVDGLDRVELQATISVDKARDQEKARNHVDEHLTMTLERRGDRIEMLTEFDHGMWGRGSDVSLQLIVRMPSAVALRIDDGSGSIRIDDVRAAVRIDDGSGSIKIHSVGPLEINDGSGSIVAEDVIGDVDIIDGSGSINVAGVSGSVVIDDGSGSITVRDVDQDLKIEESGSGSVNISNVLGSVETDG